MIRFLIGNIIMVLILIGDDIYRRADTHDTCPERRRRAPRTGIFQGYFPAQAAGIKGSCGAKAGTTMACSGLSESEVKTP